MTERRIGLTLNLSCTLAASPNRVFAACVESTELAERWGPAGFTSRSIELDVRVGGEWPFTTEARYELHRAGWTDGFVRLERHLDGSV